jgi:branched-chain amino acid transport system permease protein
MENGKASSGLRIFAPGVVAPAFLVLLAVVPFLVPQIWVSLVTEMLILALSGCALNLMLGYGGMVSFGPAGLYAVGAYTTALLLVRWEAPFVVAILAAPVAATLVGAVVGWFCVRRSAVYFALLTLAFSQIIWTIIFQWYDVTNGDNGIADIPLPEPMYKIDNVYWFSLAIVAVSVFMLWRIVNSPFGATLQAIRENPVRTEFIAVPVRRYQLAAFVISAFFLGISGSLSAVFSGSAFPAYAHWAKSTDMLVICLLGGIHAFAGPIVGSAVYMLIIKVLAKNTEYSLFFLGVILMVLVLYMRNGIVGFVIEKWRVWDARRGASSGEAKS